MTVWPASEVAKLHDCASVTVLRWLSQAGVTVPGRGHWTRTTTRKTTAAMQFS